MIIINNQTGKVSIQTLLLEDNRAEIETRRNEILDFVILSIDDKKELSQLEVKGICNILQIVRDMEQPPAEQPRRNAKTPKGRSVADFDEKDFLTKAAKVKAT